MQQRWNQNFDGEPMTDIPQKFLNAGILLSSDPNPAHDTSV